MRKSFFTRGVATFAASAMALGVIAGQDGINLMRKPKVGEVAEYAITAQFDGTDDKIKFTETQTQKVTDVRPDGSYELSQASTNVLVDMGRGLTMNQPDNTVVSEEAPNGRIKTIVSGDATDPASYRIAHLQTFETPTTPVKVGDDIKYTIPADPKLGTPAVSADYKVEGLEKIKAWDTIRLTFKTEETEGDTKSSTSGTLWVSATDGMLVKSDGKWKDVQPPGVPTPLTGTFTLERTK
jgi:hypothetical protein